MKSTMDKTKMLFGLLTSECNVLRPGEVTGNDDTKVFYRGTRGDRVTIDGDVEGGGISRTGDRQDLGFGVVRSQAMRFHPG